MHSDRRSFLSVIGGTSLFAVAGVPSSLADAFASHPSPADDTWDVTWADRVQGRFRAVFDSPGVSEGAALFRAIMWCNQYKTVYATDRKEMSPVLVFRHEGIVLAMNDAY